MSTKPPARRLRLLLISPYYDRTIPGESLSTYKWVEGICRRCDTTVLTSHKRGWKSESSPVDARQIVNWTDPTPPRILSRLDRELKPSFLLFFLRARRWIKRELRAGARFDLIHQTNPVAMRYPFPGLGLGIPSVVGPFGGGLPTPPGFSREATDGQWYRKLRNLDRLRYRFDPFLRRSYEKADLFIGVAPYVRELLSALPLQRFEAISEAGADAIHPPPRDFNDTAGPLRLLFVGRIIRTKGVIDAIRAVAVAARTQPLTFDVVGDGDSLAQCKAEADALGLQGVVRFHGRRPRDEVLDWYAKSDVFLFPSFREPSGHVVVEAMQHGLPVITSTVGGPAYFVNDECGIRVPPTSPEQYVAGLAAAIQRMATDRDGRMRMSAAGVRRIHEMVDWDSKMDRLVSLYEEVLTNRGERTPAA